MLGLTVVKDNPNLKISYQHKGEMGGPIELRVQEESHVFSHTTSGPIVKNMEDNLDAFVEERGALEKINGAPNLTCSKENPIHLFLNTT